MRRIFTKDVGSLHKRGDDKDWIKSVWDSIAKSAGRPLEDFTMSSEEAALKGLEDKPPTRSIRQRLSRGV